MADATAASSPIGDSRRAPAQGLGGRASVRIVRNMPRSSSVRRWSSSSLLTGRVTGFAPGSTVRLLVHGEQVCGEGTADDDGSYVLSVQVRSAPRGRARARVGA